MAIEEVPPEYRRGYQLSSETPADIAYSCGCTIVTLVLLLGFFLLVKACGMA